MEDDNSIRNRRARTQFTPTGPKPKDGGAEPPAETEEVEPGEPAKAPEEAARPIRAQLPAAPAVHKGLKAAESSKPVEPMKTPFVPRTPAANDPTSESEKSERAAVPLMPLAPTLRASNKTPDLSKPMDFGKPLGEVRPTESRAPGGSPTRADAVEEIFAPRPAAEKAENLTQPLLSLAETPPAPAKASEAKSSAEPAKTPFVGKMADLHEETVGPEVDFEQVEITPAKPVRGRALPRWRRKLQASSWKISRPVVRPVSRFHRAVPAPLLALGYLGLLACAAGFLIWICLPAPSVPQTAPTSGIANAGSSPTPPAGPSFSFQSAGAKKFSLNPGTNSPVGHEQAEQLADVDFRAGRFKAAELGYRKVFLSTTHRAYIGYRIYVCSLMRDQHGQAEDLRGRLIRVGVNTPAWDYATATLAFREGRTDDAKKILAESRTRYGSKCDEYDAVLRAVGYEP